MIPSNYTVNTSYSSISRARTEHRSVSSNIDLGFINKLPLACIEWYHIGPASSIGRKASKSSHRGQQMETDRLSLSRSHYGFISYLW